MTYASEGLNTIGELLMNATDVEPRLCPMSLDDCEKDECDGCSYDHLWCACGARIPDEDLLNHDACPSCRNGSWVAYNTTVAKCATFQENHTCDGCGADPCVADHYRP